ncbi:hypothetical protein BH20ACT21_BH20ACT21_23050 [soil metagenome]
MEGSTRLLERLGKQYRDVQHRHNSIIREDIAEGDGREVSTEGDSFFAVFPAPSASSPQHRGRTGLSSEYGWDSTPARGS